MKRRMYLHRPLAFLLCAVMACSLMSVTAFAIKGPDPVSWGAPHISDLYMEENVQGYAFVTFRMQYSDGARKAIDWYRENGGAEGYIVGSIQGVMVEWSVDGGAWEELCGIPATEYGVHGYMVPENLYCHAFLKENTYVDMVTKDIRLRVYYSGYYVDDNNKMIDYEGNSKGQYSNELTVKIAQKAEEPSVQEPAPVFSDVPAGAWYAEYVRLLAEGGLLKGKSADRFAPTDNITVAEAITLAVRFDALLLEDSDPAARYPASGAWYQPYVEYAKANGLPWQYDNYNAAITRNEFAHIFATVYKNHKALYDEGGVVQKNEVRDGAIPDVPMTYRHAEDIYTLYRLGVLTGSDAARSFRPETNIQRCEVAAIVARLGEPDYMQSFTLK